MDATDTLPTAVSGAFLSAATGWMAGGAALYTTSDGGAQWEPVDVAGAISPGWPQGGVQLRADFGTPLQGWLLVTREGIQSAALLAATADGGLEWHAPPPP